MLFGLPSLSLSADVCVPFRASGQMWIESYNVTMITTQAAKKIENILPTPLYRLRTVIFRAVLPSRRVTEPQPPQAGLDVLLQNRRRNPRSPDRRRLAPAMGPVTQRGLRKLNYMRKQQSKAKQPSNCCKRWQLQPCRRP